MVNLPWRVSVRLMALAKKIGMVVGIVLIVLLAVRVYLSQKGPELHLWHTWRADEMSVREMDNADFARYIARENAIFADLDNAVTAKTEGEERTPLNRYYRQSLVWPGQFTPDANRSFVLMPAGKPRGAVVLLHGLTDSPYSVRRLAVNYQQHGFVAVVPRLPGHGTAPGALTDVDWEMWLAATRLAVREATRLAGEAAPLHLVGYSNGGALAMKYALDALDAPALRKPQQVILLSPMIGVTAFARFAGFAGLPALLPAFAKAAWLNISPEYNPYKYNSFPVNAARQSWLLTKALQEQIGREARENRLANLPPILAFQSVMDSTVSTRAVVTACLTSFRQTAASWWCLTSIRLPASVRCSNRRRGRQPRRCCRLRRGVTVSQLLPMPASTASRRWRKSLRQAAPGRRSCRSRRPGRRMSIPCRTLRCRSRRMTIFMAVSLG